MARRARAAERRAKLPALAVALVALAGCSDDGGRAADGAPPPPAGADADGDGLSDAMEAEAGSDPADSDGDGVWDAEEVMQLGTDPLWSDSDGDGISDRADPRPAQPDAAIPPRVYAVFRDNDLGSARTQLTATRMEENHVVITPPGTPGGPSMLYQTYLADEDLAGRQDGLFTEADLRHGAIAAMNLDGTRPRLLTDTDADGRRANDGAIDATQELSPDGAFVVFASNRHDPSGLALRLYAMRPDGSDPVQLAFADGAPAADELDSDPDCGPGDTVAFKRERITTGPRFSRVHTARIDRSTMRLSDVTRRTDVPEGVLASFPPGDFDPKIFPDGAFLASYRHLADPADPGNPADFGDWDAWVGPISDPAQPDAGSIAFLEPDPGIIDLFPRWNQTGDKLGAVALHAGADRQRGPGRRCRVRFGDRGLSVLGGRARRAQRDGGGGLDRDHALLEPAPGGGQRARLLRPPRGEESRTGAASWGSAFVGNRPRRRSEANDTCSSIREASLVLHGALPTRTAPGRLAAAEGRDPDIRRPDQSSPSRPRTRVPGRLDPGRSLHPRRLRLSHGGREAVPPQGLRPPPARGADHTRERVELLSSWKDSGLDSIMHPVRGVSSRRAKARIRVGSRHQTAAVPGAFRGGPRRSGGKTRPWRGLTSTPGSELPCSGCGSRACSSRTAHPRSRWRTARRAVSSKAWGPP